MKYDLGTAARPLRVAVIGAGPSGFYTAQALLQRKELTVTVDLFDRLPAPYGLVRYGVAPDHQKIKAVSRVFESLCRDERVRFFGHVGFGSDVSREDLLARYDQIVYAVGGQSDRRLGIPGEELDGSVSSTELVAWYSGHPDFIDRDYRFDHRQVAVIGIGNVAMDVTRVLAKRPEELATTDIADLALERLRESRVTDVHVLARRGPVQAKCSPQELKEIGEIEGARMVVRGAEIELDPGSARALEDDRSAQKNLEIWRRFQEHPDDGERRVHFRFLVSPVEILEQDGRVAGLKLERNELRPTEGGYLQSVGTGEYEILPVTLVIKAVGYRSLPLTGVPFDERRGVIPNREGRIVDPASGETIPREYVVGWVKRGPTGLIGSNKPDAVETVARMVEDLSPLDSDTIDARPQAIEELLAARGVRYVSFPDWERLDRLEVERGKPHGRPRIKLCRIEEMLAALEEADATVS